MQGKLCRMSIIKINALTVPEGQGPELEKRFDARKHVVDDAPGFKGFKLLRPTAGERRYFFSQNGRTKNPTWRGVMVMPAKPTKVTQRRSRHQWLPRLSCWNLKSYWTRRARPLSPHTALGTEQHYVSTMPVPSGDQ